VGIVDPAPYQDLGYQGVSSDGRAKIRGYFYRFGIKPGFQGVTSSMLLKFNELGAA
jgi:hypothetical protein